MSFRLVTSFSKKLPESGRANFLLSQISKKLQIGRRAVTPSFGMVYRPGSRALRNCSIGARRRYSHFAYFAHLRICTFCQFYKLVCAPLLFFMSRVTCYFRDRLGFRFNTAESDDFFISHDFPPQVVKVFFCDSSSLHKKVFFIKMTFCDLSNLVLSRMCLFAKLQVFRKVTRIWSGEFFAKSN